MRVLHVYSGNLFGGIETMLLTMARERALCPAIEPAFALCFEGRLGAELAATGVAVQRLPEVRASRPLTIRRAMVTPVSTTGKPKASIGVMMATAVVAF